MDRAPASDHHRGPDDELRARARRQFVAGAFDAERVLRSAGDEPGAEASFRTRLRDDFVHGRLGARVESWRALREACGHAADASYKSRLSARFVLGELAPEGAEQTPTAPIHSLEAARRRRLPAVVAGLVAAAALLVTSLPSLFGPEWQPRPDANVAGVVFDQEPMDGERPLAARTDRVLACGPEALRLSLEDRALVQLSPTAQIRFCAPVWTLFGDVRAPVHVDAGTLDVQTLRGESSLDLELDTPNARVSLDRGALSVEVGRAGTCVVVARGAATVHSANSDERIELREGQRVFVPRDGGPCQVEQHYAASNPGAEQRLRSLRAMLVDVEAGVF